jgi:geranylgeranyl diphosphate synthase type I
VAFEDLLREVTSCADAVYTYIDQSAAERAFAPEHLREGVLSYFGKRGKSLRASLVMFSCGAVGGDPLCAAPAAAAVEVFHVFSLVHDDIIDNDRLRRGAPTVHERFRLRALDEFGVDEALGRHYGISVGILAGDAQQGWSTYMLADLRRRSGADPSLCLGLIEELSSRVLPALVDGELLDVQYSLMPIDAVTDDHICDMMQKKTGALYEFSAKAGALIGLATEDVGNPSVCALAKYARDLGLAFQIRDDILGVLGDETHLGKAVGSDLREGKRTLLISHALANSSESDRKLLLDRLGDPALTPDEMRRIVDVLARAGSIEHAEEIAQRSVESALAALAPLPPSRYRDLLTDLAHYIMQRTY